MTQTAQMIQSWWIYWILDELSTNVFIEQDREQEIITTIDEHLLSWRSGKQAIH